VTQDWTAFEEPDWGDWAVVKDDWKCPPEDHLKYTPERQRQRERETATARDRERETVVKDDWKCPPEDHLKYTPQVM